MGLSLAIPAMLIGLAAASIPLLLHLFSRVRSPEMLFPTLRFLRLSMERTARRRRFEHLLLMILRTALLALLAFGLAQPFLKAGRLAATGQNVAAAIIIDNSRSMGVADTGPTRYAAAQSAFSALMTSSDAPRHVVLAFTNGPQSRAPAVLNTVDQRQTLIERVLSSTVAAGRADLTQTIERAWQALAESDLPNKVVYLLTDGQASSAPELARLPEPIRDGSVPLRVIDLGGRGVRNVGITSVRIAGLGQTAGVRQRIVATIVNGSVESDRVVVGIEFDGRRARHLDQRVTLEPAGQAGSQRAVYFEHVFSQEGWHEGRVVIDHARDADPSDDRRLFALRISRRVRAMVVAPRASAGQRAAGFYVMQCLKVSDTVDAVMRTPDEFTGEQLGQVDALFLCDLPRITPRTGAALNRFVERGGRLAIFLGPSAEADSYNQHSGGWMPAELTGVADDADSPDHALRLTTVRTDDPLLARLYESPSQFEKVHVRRRFNVRLRPGLGVDLLASLSDGSAFAVRRRFGRGTALLFTSSADTAWSNFAIQPLFLPIVLRFATLDPSGKERTVEHVAGDDIHIRLGDPSAKEIEVATPPDAAGRSSALRIGTDADHVALFRDAFATGIYRWRPVRASSDEARDGPSADALFAVNGDGRESVLVEMNWIEWKESAKVELTVGSDYQELRRQLAAADRGVPIWDWFLLIVLVAVTCEAMLANRYRPESISRISGDARLVQTESPAS